MVIKSRGFALMAVLLLSSVLMLLTLSQWQALILFQKMISQRVEQAQSLMCFEKTLQQLRDHTEHEGEANCKGRKMKYTILPMETFPCIHREIKGTLYSTAHIQFCIWWLDHPASRLEVRMAQPIPIKPCLSQKVRLVKSEILSWRYEDEVVEE
jgi:hypothetical protein